MRRGQAACEVMVMKELAETDEDEEMRWEIIY
jgi:hypothetical protein